MPNRLQLCNTSGINSVIFAVEKGNTGRKDGGARIAVFARALREIWFSGAFGEAAW
jgi:hypothetical protein